MIISIVTGPWLPTPALQGGAVNRRWCRLAEEFAGTGHLVNIVAKQYPGQAFREQINGVNYIRHGGFEQSTNVKLDLLKDFVYALDTLPILPTSDILLINDFWLPVFAPWRHRIKKVVMNPARVPKGQYFLYPKVNKFYAVSNAIKTALLKENLALKNRIEVISNPVDTKTLRPKDLRYSRKSPKERKTILYAGRIHPEKGVHILVEAFSQLSTTLKNLRLLIVGPIMENQGGGGFDYFNQLKLKSSGLNVEFLEPIFDFPKLAKLYREADLFCYPSLAEKGEAFGIAPLEAMASGVVPVVSDLDCFKDFIKNNETGYFFDHRSSAVVENLACTLKKALCSWPQTIELSKNARTTACSFSYSAIATRYLDSFQKLLES